MSWLKQKKCPKEMAAPFQTLDRSQVHVWLIDSQDYASCEEELFSILSCEEQGKANRFKFARDRSSYVIFHAILRQVLGQYLSCDPKLIVFRYNAHGKPFLENKPISPTTSIYFNLSHSHRYALIGVSHDALLGVDVEYKRPIDSIEKLVDRFFSKKECDQFFQVPPEGRRDAFYRLWTKKEAWIKAVGKGLSISLSSFDLDLSLDQESKMMTIENQPDALAWQVQSFIPDQDYVASVAWQGEQKVIAFFKG